MRQIVTKQNEILGQWLYSKTGGSYIHGMGQYIGLVDDGKILAVAGYENCNTASVHCHIAVEGMMNREFLRYIFAYPFNELKVKKLIGIVPSFNEKALKLDKHLGFIEECVIKDAHPGGDLHILTMTKEQCKFITNSGNPDERTLIEDNHHGTIQQTISTSSS